MSTLEKTINLLSKLPEQKIGLIYNYAQFVFSQEENKDIIPENSIDDILRHLTGIVPDSGKTLKEYQEERRQEWKDS